MDKPAKVAECLRYCGIRGLRDDGSTNLAAIQGWVNIHNTTGAKMCLLPITGNLAQSVSVYEQLAAQGALLAIEGPNEPNNAPVTYEGAKSSKTNSLPVARFQKDLCPDREIRSHAGGHSGFCCSSEAGGSQPNNCGLQFLTIPSGAGTLMPDGTVYADFANTHNYVCDHLSSIVNNNAWDAEPLP